MNTNHFGPKTQIGETIHNMKYREPGEDFRELCNRVAYATKDSDTHYRIFRDITLDMRFMPAGRVQNAMGSLRQTTPWNCFVSGTIPDSFTDRNNRDKSSIMHRADQAAATMRMGGGIGYDFSPLRPRGFRVGRIGSNATGPVSFMTIYDAVCRTISSSGHRRGAQMGILRVDHPDIEEFVRAKQNEDQLTGFNISVAVTDEFMDAVEHGKTFKLRWGDYIVNEIDAQALFEKMMRSTWDWGEPGVFFVDRVNEFNNLHYCETIAATNPCGEQPLPPFGACLLGSINMVKYLRHDPGVGGPVWVINYDQVKADIPHIIRAMDNIVDRGRYPLPEQEIEGKSKRRMGIGVMGVANAIEACGLPYGSTQFIKLLEDFLEVIRDESYRASIELAKEKGPFQLFKREEYLASKFIQTLPDDIIEGIEKHGIRNSHLTSIAPTGTISLSCDNISSGIEPVFAYEGDRKIYTPDKGQVEFHVEDYGYKFLGVKGKLSKDVTAEEHINVLVAAQKKVDSAVSKTVIHDRSMPWNDFKNLYMMAWKGGAKGCTTYNREGRRAGIMKEAGEEGMACKIDTQTGERDCS